MDTLEHYRALIKQVIRGHAHQPAYGKVRIETIFDEHQDHYELVESGWTDRGDRIEGTVIHIDIINDKIWIQFDGTEYGVARELEDLGVPRHDIVLAFHSPAKRPFTGYAVS